MITEKSGFKALSKKVDLAAAHPIQAANEPTETKPTPSPEPTESKPKPPTEPEKTVAESK